MMDIIASRDLNDRLAGITPCKRFQTLVVR
jgi:hypothetical protein